MSEKRNIALQSLSREHHHALLLCWKIKMGFSKGVSIERIKAYSTWFYKNHILNHFEMEEKFIFPILGNQNELVLQALKEHKILLALFEDNITVENSLRQIQIDLTKHIRFEEQILFNEIQEKASQDQLNYLQKIHNNHEFEENVIDVFWK